MIDEDKIVKGIEAAKLQGYKLCEGLAGLEGDCGCALSLAALGLDLLTREDAKEKGEHLHADAGRLLGLTTKELCRFCEGFDGLSNRKDLERLIEDNSDLPELTAGLVGIKLRSLID